MSTVANTVKDISRAVSAAVEDGVTDGSIERVAGNLAYVLGKNVNLRKLTRREVAVTLAAHGFEGNLPEVARRVLPRVKAMADEYGRMSSQL